MLWTWFEEDHILSQRLGQFRFYTDEDGYFKHPTYWPADRASQPGLPEKPAR